MSPKRPSQEELQQNGITVEIEFNMHCTSCLNEVRKCCKSKTGVSEVQVVESVEEGKARVAVTGVFEPEKLIQRLWKKCTKIAQVVKITKLNEQEENQEEQDEEGEEEQIE
ncbi:hypothetical protein CJ030_MR2G007116 [Morella rubra]|uniref:HMA domain-containing protein n=1 Tax=Morella rubra TaxID=262757 RepID=A0A6A1WGS8_9ROSI|nr:hypothetical protein CJ030_MR2G007116 [Morella rubra]